MEKIYSLPPALRVYAIGDIHGHLEALEAMHEAIFIDLLDSPPEDKVHIVYLGDYVDRGPESKGVIDCLIGRQRRGDGIAKSFLMGNHEMAVFEFLKDPLGTDWLDYGGIETLGSYGVSFENQAILPAEKERASTEFRAKLPPEHLEFLKNLDLYAEIGDYIFVHAGIHPEKPLSRQNESDLTFIREPFLSWHKNPAYKPLEKKIVHGHSVYEKPENKPHRISIDTGLYEGGPLTAAVLEGKDVRFLQVS